MKLAIMQPYLFPYIGYFQLINAVDKFVILDDVNYINKGWINRNRILVNNKEYLFSIPIKKASQNKLILECELSDDPWREKLLKTIEMSYKKAPYFNDAFPVIVNILDLKDKNISLFIFNHFALIFQYLDIKKEVIQTSSIYKTQGIKAQEKIIEICKKEQATDYINPIGGTELYDSARFEQEKINLRFIKTKDIVYPQFTHNFIPWLSIIDVLMFNSKEEIKSMLNQFELV